MTEQTNIIQQKDLTEFADTIQTKEELQLLAANAITNRSIVYLHGQELGINPEYLLQQPSFLVGPFIHPSPLSTIYGNDLRNWQQAIETTMTIANELAESGQIVRPVLAAYLQYTEAQTGSSSAQDTLTIPNNQTTNKKLKLIPKIPFATNYNAITVKRRDLESLYRPQGNAKSPLKNAIDIQCQRDPTFKKKTKVLTADESTKAADILLAISGDLQAAVEQSFGCEDEASYLSFSMNLNKQFARRAGISIQEFDFVDSNYYIPFIQQGIQDFACFTSALESAGYFELNNSQRLFKTVCNNGTMRYISRAPEENGNVCTFEDNGELISFEELRTRYLITPSKELAYILAFGSFVPVIYGEENKGGYYRPYAIAKQVVENLTLSPIQYNIQPNRQTEEMNTIFDFYNQLLFNI